MSESFLRLSPDKQPEVLEIVREKTQCPMLLLEKEVWVVWTLGALFDSALATALTFKRRHLLIQGVQTHRPFFRRHQPDLRHSETHSRSNWRQRLPAHESQSGWQMDPRRTSASTAMDRQRRAPDHRNCIGT